MKPFPAGIRTIGSFHGAVTNSHLSQQVLQTSISSLSVKQEVEGSQRVRMMVHGNISAFRQRKPAHCSPAAQRGRRRASSAPVFSPLMVGGENYSLAPPSVSRTEERRGRMQLNRFHHPTR